MILEEIRYILEDLERLEQAVVDRLADEPTQVRDRLNQEHEVAQLLAHMQTQSGEALRLYRDARDLRAHEVRLVASADDAQYLQSSAGSHAHETDPALQLFYRKCDETLSYHQRYPNDQVDLPEQRYRKKRKAATSDAFSNGYSSSSSRQQQQPTLVDTMFSGEEGFGRFFDLNANYEAYVNLPGIKRPTYLQYLEVFDDFSTTGSAGAGAGLKKSDKMTDAYFQYVGGLAAYLESFMRKTRPLENLDRVLAGFDNDFDQHWEKDELPNWKKAGEASLNGNGVSDAGAGSAPALSTPDAVWCADCEKEFKNQNVYKGHLAGRKHVRAAELRAASTSTNGAGDSASAARLKERAIAAREYRVQRLVAAMSTEKDDTRVNVERRQGMTERERQQELENLYATQEEERVIKRRRIGGEGAADQAGENENNNGDDDDDDDDDDEKVYNPLKLPLAWDGKPIPFWLYRLHGLGVEFNCEICGQYTYMGRRAFEKHFNESRHIHGLRCLGINNPSLFRDITQIEEALRLWEKLQKEKKKTKLDESAVVQMEDAEGHVMPEKVYYDLQKQGLV